MDPITSTLLLNYSPIQLATQMSYLKIYPKRIIATLNVDGDFEGVFTLHIEQYGLQANEKKCDVKITQEGDQWQIWVQPVAEVQTPQFKQFVKSLNDYLFLVRNWKEQMLA